MAKESSLIVPTALLSCVFLVLAVWLATVLGPPSSTRHGSVSPAHVVTVNNPFPAAIPKKSIKSITSITTLTSDQRQQCYKTCKLELVESLPENLTFSDTVYPTVGSTFESWTRLIKLAEKRLIMAAYKSSFRGKHVLDSEHSHSAKMGDDIFEFLKTAGSERGVKLEAVENYPPKDRGDNEDVNALSSLGLMERRRLNMARVFRAGVMHSKFLISDEKHFYLGSANFDWRSLNQKMELGVHVENCPCLANDLKILYDTYWTSASEDHQLPDASTFMDAPALTSKSNPLVIKIGQVDTEVHFSASPRQLNGAKRDWDLDAIVNCIDESKQDLDIHVMDYVPMYVYQKPRKFWPVIDYAIRRAVVERGVKVRFLTAALHFTSESLHALRSLQIMGKGVSNGGRVDVKILNIPAVTDSQKAFARERRTHRKFIVTDDTLVIGTSNWSGDYFANTTGVAITMRQRSEQKPMIDQAKQLFRRDWNSMYATELNDYIDQCYDHDTRRDLCKAGRMAYQQTSSASSAV